MFSMDEQTTSQSVAGGLGVDHDLETPFGPKLVCIVTSKIHFLRYGRPLTPDDI